MKSIPAFEHKEWHIEEDWMYNTPGSLKRFVSRPDLPQAILKLMVPMVKWLPLYSFKSSFLKDFFAGMTLAAVSIPQSISYAVMAGLSPQTGMISAVVCSIVYTPFASSRHLGVGPGSLISVLLFESIGELIPPSLENGSSNPRYLEYAVLCSFFSGMLQLLLGLFSFGVLIDFLSQPIISAFTAGSAVLIILSQVKYCLGIQGILQSNTIIQYIVNIFGHIHEIEWHSFLISLCCLFLLVCFKMKFWMNPTVPVDLVDFPATTSVKRNFSVNIPINKLPRNSKTKQNVDSQDSPKINQSKSNRSYINSDEIHFRSKSAENIKMPKQSKLNFFQKHYNCCLPHMPSQSMIMKRPSRFYSILSIIPIQLFCVFFFTVLVSLTGSSAHKNGPIDVLRFVPSGFPHPSLLSFTSIPREHLLKILVCSISISVLGLVESVAVAEIYSSRFNYEVDMNAELRALGLMNIVGAFFHAYPTTGSMSRAAVIADSNSQTPLSQFFAGCVIFAVQMWFMTFFENLPKAVMASIVIVAVFGMVTFTDCQQLWSWSKSDWLCYMSTLICTLFLGLLKGIELGLLISIVMLVYQVSSPSSSILGVASYKEILNHYSPKNLGKGSGSGIQMENAFDEVRPQGPEELSVLDLTLNPFLRRFHPIYLSASTITNNGGGTTNYKNNFQENGSINYNHFNRYHTQKLNSNDICKLCNQNKYHYHEKDGETQGNIIGLKQNNRFFRTQSSTNSLNSYHANTRHATTAQPHPLLPNNINNKHMFNPSHFNTPTTYQQLNKPCRGFQTHHPMHAKQLLKCYAPLDEGLKCSEFESCYNPGFHSKYILHSQSPLSSSSQSHIGSCYISSSSNFGGGSYKGGGGIGGEQKAETLQRKGKTPKPSFNDFNNDYYLRKRHGLRHNLKNENFINCRTAATTPAHKDDKNQLTRMNSTISLKESVSIPVLELHTIGQSPPRHSPTRTFASTFNTYSPPHYFNSPHSPSLSSTPSNLRLRLGLNHPHADHYSRFHHHHSRGRVRDEPVNCPACMVKSPLSPPAVGCDFLSTPLFLSLRHSAQSHPLPGIVIFRFHGDIFFANANSFKKQLLHEIKLARKAAEWRWVRVMKKSFDEVLNNERVVNEENITREGSQRREPHALSLIDSSFPVEISELGGNIVDEKCISAGEDNRNKDKNNLDKCATNSSKFPYRSDEILVSSAPRHTKIESPQCSNLNLELPSFRSVSAPAFMASFRQITPNNISKKKIQPQSSSCFSMTTNHNISKADADHADSVNKKIQIVRKWVHAGRAVCADFAVHSVILDMSSCSFIDSSAAKMLSSLLINLKTNFDIFTYICNAKHDLRQQLICMKVTPHLAFQITFPSVQEAVAHALHSADGRLAASPGYIRASGGVRAFGSTDGSSLTTLEEDKLVGLLKVVLWHKFRMMPEAESQTCSGCGGAGVESMRTTVQSAILNAEDRRSRSLSFDSQLLDKEEEDETEQSVEASGLESHHACQLESLIRSGKRHRLHYLSSGDKQHVSGEIPVFSITKSPTTNNEYHPNLKRTPAEGVIESPLAFDERVDRAFAISAHLMPALSEEDMNLLGLFTTGMVTDCLEQRSEENDSHSSGTASGHVSPLLLNCNQENSPSQDEVDSLLSASGSEMNEAQIKRQHLFSSKNEQNESISDFGLNLLEQGDNLDEIIQKK